MAVFLRKVHTLYPEPVKFFKPLACSGTNKGGVGHFLIKWEELGEEVVGEEYIPQGETSIEPWCMAAEC